MTAEVLAALQPERGGLFVDCTVGLGGHARALLSAGATRLIGIDRDPAALALAGQALAEWGGRIDLVHGDYRDLPRFLDARGIDAIDGAVADFGVSSMQLDGAGRGFSFQRDEALDMRMDTSQGLTAADLLSDVAERDLADVIFRYGEERRSRAVARAIVAARREAPIRTTAQLAGIVRRVVRRSGRIDPATRLVESGGEARNLTAKEFDLLYLLARNPRQVFTRDQLLDRVWGLTEYIDASTITVHVRRLREKIEADPANPRYIQTMWGVGYKFEP